MKVGADGSFKDCGHEIHEAAREIVPVESHGETRPHHGRRGEQAEDSTDEGTRVSDGFPAKTIEFGQDEFSGSGLISGTISRVFRRAVLSRAYPRRYCLH